MKKRKNYFINVGKNGKYFGTITLFDTFCTICHEIQKIKNALCVNLSTFHKFFITVNEILSKLILFKKRILHGWLS